MGREGSPRIDMRPPSYPVVNPSYQSTSSIWILSTHLFLDLSSYFFSSRLPAKILRAFLSSPARYKIPFHLIIVIIILEVYKS